MKCNLYKKQINVKKKQRKQINVEKKKSTIAREKEEEEEEEEEEDDEKKEERSRGGGGGGGGGGGEREKENETNKRRKSTERVIESVAISEVAGIALAVAVAEAENNALATSCRPKPPIFQSTVTSVERRDEGEKGVAILLAAAEDDDDAQFQFRQSTMSADQTETRFKGGGEAIKATTGATAVSKTGFDNVDDDDDDDDDNDDDDDAQIEVDPGYRWLYLILFSLKRVNPNTSSLALKCSSVLDSILDLTSKGWNISAFDPTDNLVDHLKKAIADEKPIMRGASTNSPTEIKSVDDYLKFASIKDIKNIHINLTALTLWILGH